MQRSSSSFLSFCKTVSSRFKQQHNCLDRDSSLSRRVDFSYISSSINKFYEDDCIWKKNHVFFSRSLNLAVKVKKQQRKKLNQADVSHFFLMDHKFLVFGFLCLNICERLIRSEMFGVIVSEQTFYSSCADEDFVSLHIFTFQDFL